MMGREHQTTGVDIDKSQVVIYSADMFTGATRSKHRVGRGGGAYMKYQSFFGGREWAQTQDDALSCSHIVYYKIF